MLLQHPAIPFFRTAPMRRQTNPTATPVPQAATTAELPPSVHLLNFDVWNARNRTVLLRLAHLVGAGEHPELSAPARVHLVRWLRQWAGEPLTIDERTLSTVWPVQGGGGSGNHGSTFGGDARGSQRLLDSLVVTLHPLDVRTYLIRFAE